MFFGLFGIFGGALWGVGPLLVFEFFFKKKKKKKRKSLRNCCCCGQLSGRLRENEKRVKSSPDEGGHSSLPDEWIRLHSR